MAGQGSKGGGVAANPAVPANATKPSNDRHDGYASRSQHNGERNLVST